jgi:hypothetical protein
MRRHIKYANVVSTLCLVLLLGGTAYAAAQITGKDIKNASVTGKDVKNSSLKGKDLKDGSVTVTDLASSLLPGARMQNQTPIVIASGQSNPLDMTEEDFDTGEMYAPGGDHITITRTGTYVITGFIAWSGSASDTARQVRIHIDDVVPSAAVTIGSATPAGFTQEVTSVERLLAGQRVSLGAFNGSGGNVGTTDLTPPLPSVALTVQMVSP